MTSFPGHFSAFWSIPQHFSDIRLQTFPWQPSNCQTFPGFPNKWTKESSTAESTSLAVNSSENAGQRERRYQMWLLLVQWDLPAISAPPQSLSSDPSSAQILHTASSATDVNSTFVDNKYINNDNKYINKQYGFDNKKTYGTPMRAQHKEAVDNSDNWL